jgi:xanthine dehydrogenase/oxidase
VNAAFYLKLVKKNESYIVERSNFSFGGMGPIAMQTKNTNAYLQGKDWTPKIESECYNRLLEDLPLGATAPGGQIQFRKTLALSFFHKFVLRVNNELSFETPLFRISSLEECALKDLQRGISCGGQVYQESTSKGLVGKSVKHAASDKQLSGEAIYVDDIPKFHNELYGVIVTSTVAHGIIEYNII